MERNKATGLGHVLCAFAFGAGLVFAGLAGHPDQSLAQSGGPYLIRRGSIDAGGASRVAGGAYSAGVTAGQLDAGSAGGTAYALGGGFWGGGNLVAAPTPTAPQTPSPTRTPTTQSSSTPTPIVPPTHTPTLPLGASTNTPTRTVVSSATPSASRGTVTATPSPTATATPPEVTCAGDCDASGAVSVDELVRGVNMALERAAVSLCPAMNGNNDARITINELVAAVNAALGGC